MADVSTLEKLRPLGRLEKYSTCRHALGFYNNVGMHAKYENPTSSVPLKTIIYKALGLVIAQHPILSVIAVDELSEDAYFARLPQVDLDRAVSFVTLPVGVTDSADASQVEKILNIHHQYGFKEQYGELPFWRLVILHRDGDTTEFTAFFFFHHSIADGSSGLAFHRSLQAALSTVSKQTLTSEAPCPIVTSPSVPLLPELEALHPLPLSIWFLLKALWSEWFPPSNKGFWFARPIDPAPELTKRRIRVLVLEKDISAALVRISREHGTTLTGTVETVLAAVILAHLPNEYSQIRAAGPVSFRRWLPADKLTADDLGVYVDQYIEDHARAGTSADPKIQGSDFFSWDKARQVRSTIEEKLSSRGHNASTGLLRYVSSTADLFRNRIGKQRTTTLEVSNVGRYTPMELETAEKSWSVGRMCFSQSPDVQGAAIITAIVSGGDGCLSISFGWLEGIVDTEWVEKVIAMSEQALHQLVQG